MNQGKKTLLVEKKIMGKTLNENWHISTILKRVCSVIQHHWARSFRWLSVASLVCNTSNETILNQLSESSSHSESCKCTRGQEGEEWPEETRLHSWWRHWVLQQWHCGTTTLEHSRLELPTSSLEWWWESLMERKWWWNNKHSWYWGCHGRRVCALLHGRCSHRCSALWHIQQLLHLQKQFQVMSATLEQCNTPTLEQGSNPSL